MTVAPSLAAFATTLLKERAAMGRKKSSTLEQPRCESLIAAIGMAGGCVAGGLLGRAAVVAHLAEPGLGTTLIVLVFAFAGALIGQAICHRRSQRLALR
jgi:hypothetical protein